MKRLIPILVASVLVAITGGQVLADPCTFCKCGMDESQCNAIMPSCGGAKHWRQQQLLLQQQLQQQRPTLPRQISLLGKADGQTNGNKPFGFADSARGSMSLNVMGRKDIRVINANWHATYQGRAADESDYAPSKRQVWEFVAEPNPAGKSPGDVVGMGKVTITGNENGATGTVSGLKVVTNTGTLLKVKFQVQFVGDKLQLTGFHEDLSK